MRLDNNRAWRLGDNLLGDLAIVGEDDLVDVEGGLDGVGLVVDPLELLEGAALGLDTVGPRLIQGQGEREFVEEATYPQRYQMMDSTISQPTNTKMYL